MKNRGLAGAIVRLNLILLIGAAMVAAGFSWLVWKEFYEDKFVGVGLTGIQHLGTNYKIDEFNVDGTDGGNVGWEGGGGSSTCCVDLPKKWKPGVTVMVRWAVGDWSKANRLETSRGNYRSVASGGMYRARIPVEKYVEPEDIYVHFFAGGKARVVSSQYGRGIYHPIPDDDARAIERATAGTPVEQLFTQAELAEIRRKADERNRRHGDWR